MAIEKYRGGWLRPWHPFRELEEFRQRMEEWLKPGFWRTAPVEGAAWAPPIEMYEEKDKYVVKAELPGMKKDEIEVSITDNVLTIKGERKAEEERKESNYYCCERYYGSFLRSINLPGNVDAKKISAGYKDGILEISLPKTAEEKEKKIEVKIE